MTALLEARNVTKRFGGGLFNKQYTLAVDNVSLSVGGDTPTVTATAGESGSGKTTLARMLLNMLEPTEGSVEYKGKSLSALSQRERKDFRPAKFRRYFRTRSRCSTPSIKLTSYSPRQPTNSTSARPKPSGGK